ncbi:MAG: ParB N-terminal domain-containing protein [bacterium]|nr:ParB N-terminal domain-containing protein [bacterium]
MFAQMTSDAHEENLHTIFSTTHAIEAFDRARTKGLAFKLWSFFTRKPSGMLSLRDIHNACIRTRHYEGDQTVNIDHIRGSENRMADFDAQFHPLHLRNKERWVNVATAMLQDSMLPPVELIKVDGTYFVRDGHHRVSAARALGQCDIDAVVTSWETFCSSSSQN